MKLVDLEDAISECMNSWDASDAALNIRDYCEVITEQEIVKPYLDKIRAEIEALEYLNIEDGSDGYDKYIEQYEVLKTIDKYKAESENEE